MKSGLHKRAVKIANALVAFQVGLIVFNIAWSGLFYRLSDTYQDYLFELLALFILLRSALALPIRDWAKRWPWKRKLSGIGMVVLYGYLIYFLCIESLAVGVAHVVHKRSAHQGATNRESMSYFYDYGRWYPRPSFINEVAEQVGEDEGILYFGDLRGHMFSYLLYPRKVYVHPEIQLMHDQNEQCRWISEDSDPLQPYDKRFDDVASGLDNPEVVKEIDQAIDDRGIEWVIIYDSLKPEETLFYRIRKEADSAE